MAIINLRTSDGRTIPMERSAVAMSSVLNHLLNDGANDLGEAIPVPNVDSVTLRDIIQYCQKKHELQSAADQFKAWENEFKKQIVTFPKLFRLINASEFLNIDSLKELTTEKAVEMMKDLSLDDVRKHFDLPNDFPKEEEARLRERFGWAFK